IVPQAAKSILMVEFLGEDATELQSRLEKVWLELRHETPVLEEYILATRPEDRERIWAVRSSSEPLLNRRPGRKRAIAFVEDAAVATDRLGQYIRAVEETFQSRGIEYGVYGHAGVGVLHVR